ncbi:MAG: hypothetical protein RSD28_01995 [Lachnospiraceae bacterium]
MKKILTAALAMVMTLTMGMTALAAPSVTQNNIVGAKDKNGKAVEVTMKEVAATTATDASNNVKTVLGTSYKETMKVLKVMEVSAPAGTVFPITITFKAEGVNAKSSVYVMHYNGTAWEKITAVAGEGTITATFNSLSPVALVVDTKTTTGAPKTADNGVAVAGIVAIIALGGIAIASKRKVQA